MAYFTRSYVSFHPQNCALVLQVCSTTEVELTSLREQHQQERQAASVRICELERQVTTLTSVVTEELARVRELWRRIEAAEQERLAALQVVAQQAPVASRSLSATNLLWCLLLLVLGVCLTVATQR